MKKILIGILALVSISAFSQSKEDLSQLPKGIQLKLVNDIQVRKSKNPYVLYENGNEFCYLRFRKDLTVNGDVIILPHEVNDALPTLSSVTSKAALVGDVGGNVAFRDIALLVAGSGSLVRIDCVSRDPLKQFSVKDFERVIPDIKLIVPNFDTLKL